MGGKGFPPPPLSYKRYARKCTDAIMYDKTINHRGSKVA